VDEGDIGTYTVLAAADPRAANRTLYVKPLANTLSHSELLALWETKTGKAFERVHIPEDAVLKQIQDAKFQVYKRSASFFNLLLKLFNKVCLSNYNLTHILLWFPLSS